MFSALKPEKLSFVDPQSTGSIVADIILYCVVHIFILILSIIPTGPPNTIHYIWIGVGVGAVIVVLFLIAFVVVGLIVLLKLKSKRANYVQVNSYGDVKE